MRQPQRSLSVGNANRDTGREFGAKKNAQMSTLVNEGIGPTNSLCKTCEFSGVVAAQELAPRNAGGRESRTTGPQRIRTTFSGETTATPQPAISVRSTVRLKPPSVKSLQPGDSKPVSLVVIRQVGNVVILLWLGEPEGIVSELFRSEPQARRLTTVSSRRTQGSHYVDSPIHELTEVETRTTVGSLQVVSCHERIKKISNQNAKSMASNGNFEQKLIKESRRRSACAGARPDRT